MSVQSKYKKCELLGVEVDAVTIDQAIDYIVERTQHPGAAYVVKPYVEFMERAANDPSYAKILNEAELCLADGISINWAANYLHHKKPSFGRWLTSIIRIMTAPKSMLNPLPDRILGINFTWPLLQRCAAKGLRIFLVGTPISQTIVQTAEHLKQALPELKIVGTYGGYFPPGNEDELIQTLRKAKPDIILVGMGGTKLQEQLISRLSTKLSRGVLIGEGGTFDYQQFGGKLPKAPVWIQRINLEWLWRLVRQPGRIGRQMAIPRFMWRVYQEGKRLS